MRGERSLPHLVLRAERPGDATAIAGLHARAFGGEEESQLVEAIRRSDRYVPGLSIVAEIEGHLVGHLLLSHVDLVDERDAPVARVLILAPMSVAPDWQRHGIGSALVRTALRRARARGERLVVLVGHPAFYPRFGFAPARAQGIAAPIRVPDDAWMARWLGTGEEHPRGRIVFPPAFTDSLPPPPD